MGPAPKIAPGTRALGLAHAARAAVALAALLALAPGPARAAPGLSLGWQDCRSAGGPGFGTQAFGCLATTVEFPLFPSFVLASRVDSVYVVELVIDVDVATDVLPDWWHMEPSGCHAAGWSADGTLAGSCGDAWAGNGVASFQGWLPGTPGASARHGRLLVAAGAAAGTFVALDADVPYTACRILLRSNNTLTCNGCSIPACLVFNSMLIRRLPGSSVEEVLVDAPEVAGSNWVFWQGGAGADCQSVPVRRSTWGAVKSLYR